MTTVKPAKALVLETFPKEELLKESDWNLWNQIFSTVLESIEKPNQHIGLDLCTSTNQPLTLHMQNGESRL